MSVTIIIYLDPSIESITMQLKHFKESTSSTHHYMWEIYKLKVMEITQQQYLYMKPIHKRSKALCFNAHSHKNFLVRMMCLKKQFQLNNLGWMSSICHIIMSTIHQDLDVVHLFFIFLMFQAHVLYHQKVLRKLQLPLQTQELNEIGQTFFHM